MHIEEIQKVAVQAAELLEYFKRAGEASRQASNAATDKLQYAAGQAPEVLRQAAAGALRELSQDTVRTVAQGLERPVTTFEARLQEATVRINETSNTFTAAVGRISSLERRLLFITTAVASAMAVLVVAAAGLLWYFTNEIRSNQVSAELLKAYSQADVNFCDGRLCAKLDENGKRYGVRGQEYRVIKGR